MGRESSNPFDGLQGVTVDDGHPEQDVNAPSRAAPTASPDTAPVPGASAGPSPVPPPPVQLDEHARAAIQRALRGVVVEPFALAAFALNNAAWLDAAEKRDEQLAAALFDLGDVLGWWRDGGAMPPWVFPSLALMAATRGVVVDALTAPAKPLRKPAAAPSKKDGEP